MSFAEQVELDCSVFFNLDEFAEPHNVAGSDVVSIVNEISSEKWSDGTQLTEFDNSVSVKKAELTLKASDLEFDLVAGGVIEVDTQEWEIFEARNIAGVLTVKLIRYL